MKSRSVQFLSLVLVLALLLCACSSGAEKTDSNGTPAKETVGAAEVAAAAPTGTSTVYVQVHQDGGTWNPWGSNQEPFMSIRCNFYETLFQWLPGGQVAPLLVDTYEWSDEVTLNIKLHDNIIDHMGNQITASDVLFSFAKAAETSEYGRHAKNVDLEASHAVDDLNLVLVIKAPNAFFTNDMTRVSIVSQASYESCGDDMVNLAVGSGPYKMVSYTSGYEWVLEKYENYWNAGCEIQQRQNVDRIVYRVIAEEAQRTIELETGNVDILAMTPSIDVEYLEGIDGITVYRYPGINTVSLYYNCGDGELFADENLRHAFSCAVDSEGIASAIYNDLYMPADNIATPPTAEYEAGQLKHSYNMDKAREYLDQSGYQQGTSIRLMCTAADQPTAEIIQNSLGQLGVTVEINVYDAATYNSLIMDHSAWDCMISGYACVGSTVLFTMYNQFNDATNNRSNWHDEAFQTLLAEAAKTGDHEQSMELLNMMNEADVVRPIVYPVSFFAYRTDVITEIEPKSDNWILPGDFTYNTASAALYD